MPDDNPLSPAIPLDDGTGATVPKTAEALAGGFGGLASVSATIQLGRYRDRDDPQRQYGDRLYDRVRLDPFAGGSVEHLCMAALANDAQISPAARLDAGATAQTPEQQADLDLSAEVAGYCQATVHNLAAPFHATAHEQIMNALEYGCNVADKVWDFQTGEDGKTYLSLKAIKPKARRAWAFEVDGFWNLKFVVGQGLAGWQRFPREKFAVLTWGQRGGDPRGESVYLRAVEPWNFRVQLPEDHFRFLKRFGTPKVVGKLSQRSMAAGSGVKPGTSMLARLVDPLADFLGQLLTWVNGSVLAVGEGDSVEVHDVKSEGQAFTAAMDLYGREIVRAILLQVRATVEAKNGSKADSETSADVLGNLIMYIRRWYCRMYEWDVLYPMVAYKYGAEIARKHTPRISLGSVEHQDMAALLTALGTAGYVLDDGQFPSIDAFLGNFRVRTAEDIANRRVVLTLTRPDQVANEDQSQEQDDKKKAA